MKRFYRRVIGMGFTMLNTCYPMSIDSDQNGNVEAVYAATATDRIVSFSDMEKAVLFEVMMECVAKFRSQIRVFSPMTSLFTLYRHYKGSLPVRHPSFACRGGMDFFFIDAQKGETFPCGYRGKESMGKYWEIDQSKKNNGMSCRMCDWECFRDPSEQFSLFLQAVSRPGDVWDRIMNDRRYIRYWLSDIKYYRACRYFDGRKPPEWNRIERSSDYYRHMNQPRLINPTLTLSQ
jgi:hypothetical protein